MPVESPAAHLCRWNLGVRILGLWVNKRWSLEVIYDSDAERELE